jgi:hypothetical protein
MSSFKDLQSPKKTRPKLQIDSNPTKFQNWKKMDPYQLDFKRNSEFLTDELYIIIILNNKNLIWDSINYNPYLTIYSLYARMRERHDLRRSSYIKIDKYEYDEYQMKNYYLRDIIKYTDPKVIQIKYFT